MNNCQSHTSCIDQAITKAESICEEKGIRFTELRRKVLSMIWQSHCPAKAYDILDKLKDGDSAAKPPTVYRALDFLLENGLIHKINSLNAYVGCSHPLKHNECYFLICRNCGEIDECCSDQLTQDITKITDKKHFNFKNITLEIEGECQRCSS